MHRHSRFRSRRGIAGIIAGLILFVILFTVGTGYFLWVNTNDQAYVQALASRNAQIQNQQGESINLAASVDMTFTPATSASGYLMFTPTNTGGEPVNITTVLVTDTSGNPLAPEMNKVNIVLNSGSTTSAQPTDVQFCSTATTCLDESVVIKVVTQRGSVFSVTYTPPSLTTALGSATIVAGESVTDSASLSGITYNAGGAVTFYWFPGQGPSTGSCPTDEPGVESAGATSLSNGGPTSFTSTSVDFPNTGSYTWYAVYSGDQNNPQAVSLCELLTVQPAGLPPNPIVVTTNLSPSSSVTVGTPVTDTAKLTGATSNAGGTVTYSFYAGQDACDTPPLVVPTTENGLIVTVSGSVVPPSSPQTFTTAGDYSWNAVYSGDSNNVGPVTSACEELTVSPATPTVATTFSPSSTLAAGTPTSPTTVTDTATLSDAASNAGGTVTFYDGFSGVDPTTGLCVGALTNGGTAVGTPVQVSAGTATSSSVTEDTPGTYYWDAVYSGDTNDAGATSLCETLVVQYSPTLTTTLSSSSIVPGASVSDVATLTGAAPGAGGTVTFYYSTDSSCPTTSPTQVGGPGNTYPLADGSATSASVEFPSQNVYYWYAVYSGDAQDAGSTSPCEPLTVGLSVTTSLSTTTASQGEPVYDTASLHYVTPTAGGTVSYYDFTNGVCSGSGSLVNTVTVTDASVPPSSSESYTVLGSYSWEAVYSGDANNQGPVTSPCEPLTVIVANGGSSGSLAEVLGSFKFYFTSCNQASSSESAPECLGDGVSVGGYYGYGLSMATAGSSCPSGGFFGFGANPSCVNVVFQITLTNTDPTRSITLGPQSFLWLQGTCQTASGTEGFFFFAEGHCSSTNPFSEPLSQGYWIVNGPPTSTGDGATPLPYTDPVTIAPGAEATLYFYCSGPCTTAQSLESSSPSFNPPPGTYVQASLDLYGLYSDDTPFGQSIPFIASYISPVQIVGCATGTDYLTGGSCWPNPSNPDLTATAGSSVTLAVDGLPCTSVTTSGEFPPTTSCTSGDSFPLYAYWVNAQGGVTEVGTNPSCSYAAQETDGGYCTVTFQVPSNAAAGTAYAVYVTSDGVNNAYATVYVPQISTLTTNLVPSSTVSVGTAVHDTATLGGVTATAGGSVTYYYTSSSSCSATGATTVGAVTVTDGVVPNSPSHTFSTSGTYYWFAVYTGDANNAGSTSPCEPLTVENSFTISAPALATDGEVSGGTTVATITIGGTGTSCTGGTLTTVTESMLGSSGYTTDVPAGTDICYSFTSPVSSTSTTMQYAWSATGGTGSAAGQTGQAGSFTLNSNSEVTGTYVAQYQVTFSVSPTGDGSTTPSGTSLWENAGSLAISASVNSGYAFSDWTSSTGSITFASSTSSSTTATIGGSGTITANFVVTYTLTVSATPIETASGVSGTTTILTLTIGGAGTSCTGGTSTSVTKTMLGSSGYSTAVPSGSDVCYSYTSPVSSSGSIQYSWSSTSGTGSASEVTAVSGSFTMTSTSSITAAYNTQYAVTFADSGLDSSATGTVVTVNSSPEGYSSLPYVVYVTSGQSVSFTWSSPVSSSTTGKQFALTSSSQTSPYTVTGPITITGTYTPQYKVTVSSSGIGSDTSTTIVVLTVGGTGTSCTGGTPATLTESQLPYTTGYLNTGTDVCYSFNSPVSTGATTKQYVWSSTSGTGSGISATTQTGSFTLGAVSTVAGAYLTQYQITFAVSPTSSGTTSPTGTSVWENAGSLSISATASSGYKFNHWSSSTGSITFTSSTSASTTATISGTGTITANFGAFGLDTNCVADGSVNTGTKITLALPSCESNDVIVVVITGNSASATVSTITDSSTSTAAFAERGTEAENGESIFEYYTTTSAAITDDVITINMGSSHNYVAQAFGIYGVPVPSSPFDSHSGLPATGSGVHSQPTVTGISTSNPSDIIIAMEGDSGTSAQTVGSGFSSVGLYNANSQGNAVEYKIVSTTQSGITATFGTTTSSEVGWVMMVDAIDPPSLQQTSLELPTHATGGDPVSSSPLMLRIGNAGVTPLLPTILLSLASPVADYRDSRARSPNGGHSFA